MRALALLFAMIAAVAATPHEKKPPWQVGEVTSYATWEGLTGCYAPGKCATCCSAELLNDDGFTVANNYLKQGAVVEFLKWDGKRMRHCHGRVNDHTASHFLFEFSYALSLCAGASPDPCRCRPLTWSTWISWRVRKS